jgi:hypothetical protein
VRDVDCPEVRAASAWLVLVLEQLRPGETKVCAGGKLWLGNGRKRKLTDGKVVAQRCPPGSLASKLNRCPRQIQRYMAIARSAGILDNLQPPRHTVSDPRLKGRRSGHAYAMYTLTGAVPRELAVRLARHYRKDTGFTGVDQATPEPRPQSVVQATRGPLSAAARAIASAFPQGPPS